MQPTPPKPPQAVTEPAHIPDAVDTADDQEINEPPVTTLDTSPKNYYQAIGWLRGKVIKEEERYCVQIRDVNFPLYLPRRVMTVAANLEGQMAWMKCYPQSKGEGLSFKVVWMGTEHNEKSDPGIFVLRGVWQFIPQSRRPVFSIYRNELKNYENRPNNQHLPLIWSDQPPYRFRKDSEERPKFYQIMARLIPQRNCFGFVSQIADPLEQTPKRIKKPPVGAGNQGEKKVFKEDKPDTAQSPETKENSVPAAESADTQTVASPATSPIAPTPEENSPAAEMATAIAEITPSDNPPITEPETMPSSAEMDPPAVSVTETPETQDVTPSPEVMAEAPAAEEKTEPVASKEKAKATRKKTPAKSKSKKA